MSLLAPNLDDRRFQDLVDDAKRLVQQRCPEWSDHNVSDPGVTLIEAVATMVDQLLYRLNRVPDRHYVRFLELIGLRLHPPAAARAPVTFWLSAPQPDTVTIPAGAEVSTVHSGLDRPVVFSTVRDLPIVACELSAVATESAGGHIADRTGTLIEREPFECFGAEPAVGDALYVGLSQAVPSCAVMLRVTCQAEGVGVDPTQPPIAWEAWTAAGWAPCEVDEDDTGGFNRSGDTLVHVPNHHAVSVLAGQRAGWLRCVLREPDAGQPFYRISPRIHAFSVFTVGGTVDAAHAELVDNDDLGVSDGSPGQRFAVARKPIVVDPEPTVLEVGGDDGWRPWQLVDDFADSTADSRHFSLDRGAGEVALGPAIRLADGTIAQLGAVPPKGAMLRLRGYRTGGGRAGNVRPRAVSVLRSSIPYVARVENRRAGVGGVDGETLDAAKERAPLALRTRSRAVTAEDYELLAREAAPDLGRVRCVPATDEPNLVRVLVVPRSESDDEGQLDFATLRPSPELTGRVADFLDDRRMIGTRVVVEPPFYRGVTVVARLTARRHSVPSRLRVDALDALYRYLHPLTGGPDGAGWPFGRAVTAGDVHAVLQRLADTDAVAEIRLYEADPVDGSRGNEAATRIELAPSELIVSFEHQVLVQ